MKNWTKRKLDFFLLEYYNEFNCYCYVVDGKIEVENKRVVMFLKHIQGVRKKTELNNSTHLLSRKIIYALHYILVNISMECIKRTNLNIQDQDRPRCCRFNVCFEIYFTNVRIKFDFVKCKNTPTYIINNTTLKNIIINKT